MKLLFRKIHTVGRRTWVWSLLLVSCAALLVWFVGPLLAVNDYKFWASPTARLLTISVLLLGWGLGMVFVNRHADPTVSTQENDTDPRVLRRKRIDNEQHEVRSRFQKALSTLKSPGLYPGHGKRWRSELPWYLLMGPPASGKTSLLNCSGLEFPHHGHQPISDPSDTQYCNWYFAENTVVIDTAGRFLTQADNDVDSSAWTVLLELLRKRRRSRPLSGVLLAVPTELLLLGSEGEVTALARQIHGRLRELKRRLHIDVPIYLVLSKADRVPGFHEFFESLTREERDQVLGASFSRDKPTSGATELRANFEALLHRLNSQVIMRMHQERDTQRRSGILDFPNQLGQIGARLYLLVEQAFAGGNCSLRGFYLTCASQPSRTMNSTDEHGSVNARTHNAPSGDRFIRHLISRVILPEADLVDLDQRERSRIDWGQRALYLGGLTVLGLLGLLWANGFSTNHQRLENVRALAQRWDQQQSAAVTGDGWISMLESLDLRFEATRVFPPPTAVPFYERMGLYQGEVSNRAVTDAYERELRAALLPRVAQRLEEHIRANWNDRERLLNSLRAYLMLNLKERRDTVWLKDRLNKDWSLRYPGNTVLQDGLNTHFARLLEQPFTHALNEPLIAQAREVLRSESLAVVVYGMLHEQANHLPHYRLSHHLGSQGALLVGTDHVIPGLYTRQGFERYFSVQSAALVTELLRDNWVLGNGEDLGSLDMRRLMAELEQLYFRDYADHWSNAVGRVTLQTINSAGEGAQQLAGLTSAHSPIVQMLVQVRENTWIQSVAEQIDDVTQTGKGGAFGKIAVVAGKVAGPLTESLPDTARKALHRRFEPLHRLLDPDNGPTADLNQALRALDDLQSQLAGLAQTDAPELAAFELARGRMGGHRDALSHLRSASARLPRPISAWFNALAEDSWRLVLNDSYRYLNQRYQSELYSFYGKAIHKRYPFNAHSVSEVALNDFREFFKDEGIVDRFFERYMRPFVSGTPGQYRPRSIDGQSLPMSMAYLDQMATANTIRRSFFAHDPAEPQVQFKLEPYTLDPTVSRSEFRFGDRALEYRHGPILPVAFTWPSSEQDGRAALVLEKRVGRGVGIEKNTGPWSLFRLFDLMQVEYLTGRDVRVLKADLGGLRANYLLTSQRTPNPFDMAALRTFRMPVQL
ncbi:MULTISPECIES: type VI secretion system membrane subunit TssM [Pseudomonas]|uniref:type VI secretion system membrane subunit TssM n=1 Tax=Pseudomonas TaxID=286 RepID=UPI001BE897D7|nr:MULTISPECIES: type VI secretion system membrane subunit TssM [Pseudomonas]MBT2337559.1 type VI secretion system membrane subunit TssM [Pseudomonas fluorescens]MCD4530797.1 type VI secretion system membrane subunit TssM [Pseudomonas sp. C3-2018]